MFWIFLRIQIHLAVGAINANCISERNIKLYAQQNTGSRSNLSVFFRPARGDEFFMKPLF